MKRKNFRREMNKRGADKTPIGTVVRVIFLVLVIFVIAYVAYYFIKHPVGNLDTMLPNWMKTNYTPADIAPCPDGSISIGYIDLKNNIVLNNEKTVLYIGGKDNTQVLAHFSWNDKSSMGRISKDTFDLSDIYNEVMDASNRDVNHREYPSKETMRLLDKSFIFKGSICKNYYLYNNIETAKTCVLTCKVLDGVCSGSAISGKILYPTIDCPGQSCYIDETGNKLSSENITIKDASILFSITGGSPTLGGVSGYLTSSQELNSIKDLLKSDHVDLSIPTDAKLNLVVNSKIPFCYTIDNEISANFLGKDYTATQYPDATPGKDLNLESKTWSYTGEKMLFFVGWIPGTNEKVTAKWKLGSNGYLSGYNEKNIVKDSEFLEKLKNSPVGTEFYVLDVKRIFGSASFSQKIVNRFKVVRDNAKDYHIYFFDYSTLTYKKLDCNIGWSFRSIGSMGLNYAGLISDASQTLSDTIDTRCKYTAGE